jgi:hypothetical protein
MIFIYILLFIVICFIILLYYSYNISFLPKFMQNEIIREGTIGDISHFINVREDINKFNALINGINSDISNLELTVLRNENTIDIQNASINTLKDELAKIEEALEYQQNINNRRILLGPSVKPFYIFYTLENYTKLYIYSKIMYDVSNIIYTSKLYENIRMRDTFSLL